MSERTNTKGWVSALVAVAFVAIGISGLMMLLRLPISLDLKLLHVVMGIVLVVAGAIHLAMNWKTFAAHFRNRTAIIAGTAAVVIVVALLFIGGPEDPGPHRYGQGREEPGIGPGGDAGNDSGPFGNGPRGNGRGGRFGNGRFGGPGNEGAGEVE